MKNTKQRKNSERGGAGVKMVAVLAVLFLIGHAGYNYIPTAYQGQSFQQDMQTAVVQGMAVPVGVTQIDSVKARMQRAVTNNGIPSNALIEVKQIKDAVSARVAYSKQVSILPFGLYTYIYQFDHTATPTGFLLKQ